MKIKPTKYKWLRNKDGVIYIPHSRMIQGNFGTSGGSSFSYTATNFGGTNEYMAAATLTGAANSQRGLISVWLKRNASSPSTARVMYIGPMQLAYASPEFAIQGRNVSTTSVLFGYVNGETPDTSWHHYIISWDLSTAGRLKIYKDGNDVTNTVTFTVGETLDLTTGGNAIGAQSDGGGAKFWGDMCEVYFAIPPSYFDLTVQSNRELFRTAGGKPAGNLAAGGSIPSPLVYLKNPYSSFNVNSGTGGNFDAPAGTLTAAADIP